MKLAAFCCASCCGDVANSLETVPYAATNAATASRWLPQTLNYFLTLGAEGLLRHMLAAEELLQHMLAAEWLLRHMLDAVCQLLHSLKLPCLRLSRIRLKVAVLTVSFCTSLSLDSENGSAAKSLVLLNIDMNDFWPGSKGLEEQLLKLFLFMLELKKVPKSRSIKLSPRGRLHLKETLDDAVLCSLREKEAILRNGIESNLDAQQLGQWLKNKELSNNFLNLLKVLKIAITVISLCKSLKVVSRKQRLKVALLDASRMQ